MKKILVLATICIVIVISVFAFNHFRNNQDLETTTVETEEISTPVSFNTAQSRCDASNVRGNIQTQLTEWDEYLKNLKWDQDLSVQLDEFQQKHGLPFRFWGNVEYTEENNQLKSKEKILEASIQNYVLEEHPCGAAMKAFANTFPIKSKVTDEIREGNDKSILKEWTVPLEADIVGIEGNELIISYTVSPICDSCLNSGSCKTGIVFIKVKTDGTFSILKSFDTSAIKEYSEAECPSLGKLDKEEFCRVYIDSKTQQKRMLRLPVSCT